VAECRVYSVEDDSFRREVLYNLIEFDIPVKLVRLVNMGLNETYSIVWVGKNLPNMFPIAKKKNKTLDTNKKQKIVQRKG
jgi:hypothetical protein